MKYILEIKSSIIEQKKQAKKLKEFGNFAYSQKKYDVAEKYYSEAIELNRGCRLLWTNRAACRNTMKKYEEALSDCETALFIDPKCSRTIAQKGNALLNLGRFEEAKESFESLNSLGASASADKHMKKLHDVQE